ncbi:MAG: hypothetical protein O7C66_07230, partial [Alphaproteobacteria bacterium]|nr:hypothetical protein [Alphaproteobacteria bacterium]
MTKNKRKRGLPRGRRLSYGLCAAVGVLVLLCPVNGVKAQSDKLGPAVRYDVLKYKLEQAVRAKNHEQTIALIKRLRGTRLGISGEIPFYEGRAHSELNNWTGAYRSLVTYLNSVGRKGKNYKQAIALFVQAETAIKLERGKAIKIRRTERSWQIASAAYDATMRRRNNWKSRISTFGGSGNDMAWVIARRSKGGFVVGGTLRRKIEKGKGKKANHVMGLVAFNRKGEKVWHRPLGSPGNDASIRSLKSLPDGGFLIGGIHGGFQVVARVDRNGIVVKDHKDAPWITGFSKSGDESSGVVVRAGDGNFIAIGAETITRKGISPRLPFTIRFSQDGKTLGKTLYSGDAALFMHNITDATVLAGGDVVAVGEAKARAAWDTRA